VLETLGFLANGTLRLVGHNIAPAWAGTFQALFDAAWQLCEAEHGELEEYWRGRDVPSECQDKWQGLREHQPCVCLTTGIALPLCTQGGHVLLFSVDVLTAMGDDFAIKAIAHEMAHSVLYGRAEKNHWAEPRTMETYKAAERALDGLLRSWRVDQTELLEWSRKWEVQHEHIERSK
jgi:hypothetical protein